MSCLDSDAKMHTPTNHKYMLQPLDVSVKKSTKSFSSRLDASKVIVQLGRDIATQVDVKLSSFKLLHVGGWNHWYGTSPINIINQLRDTDSQAPMSLTMNRSRMCLYTRISLGCSSNAYPDCSWTWWSISNLRHFLVVRSRFSRCGNIESLTECLAHRPLVFFRGVGKYVFVKYGRAVGTSWVECFCHRSGSAWRSQSYPHVHVSVGMSSRLKRSA